MNAADPGWKELVEGWKKTQTELRQRLVIEPLNPLPRFVAGVDAAFTKDKKHVLSTAVIYDRERREIIEVAHAAAPVRYPYVPGFLSFREGPAVLAAIGKLKHPFGVICFDGQGIAHPRRCGIAAHIAITLNVPGIGVAKSRLIGTYRQPAAKTGASSGLFDKAEQIGAVLRTKRNTRPLFISIGNRVDLSSAIALVLSCCDGYRLPEPTRWADKEVANFKRKLGIQ